MTDTMGDLRKLVTSVVGDLTKSTEPKEKKEEDKPSGSIAEQVQREMAKLKQQEQERADREKKDNDVENALKELQERTQERPPVTRSRMHRFMKWGD